MISCGKEGGEELGAMTHLPQVHGMVTELSAPLGSPAPQLSLLTTRKHCLTVLGRGLDFNLGAMGNFTGFNSTSPKFHVPQNLRMCLYLERGSLQV